MSERNEWFGEREAINERFRDFTEDVESAELAKEIEVGDSDTGVFEGETDLNDAGPSRGALNARYAEKVDKDTARAALAENEARRGLMTKHYARNPIQPLQKAALIEEMDKKFREQGLPGFKSIGRSVVAQKILEIAAVDPERAKSFQNPEGWRQLWEQGIAELTNDMGKYVEDVAKLE